MKLCLGKAAYKFFYLLFGQISFFPKNMNIPSRMRITPITIRKLSTISHLLTIKSTPQTIVNTAERRAIMLIFGKPKHASNSKTPFTQSTIPRMRRIISTNSQNYERAYRRHQHAVYEVAL